ncbi:MAG: Calx-beta domain-containing protein, partial [Pseudomonadota bacterium]
VAWGTNSVTAEADSDYGHFYKNVETFQSGQTELDIFIPLVSDAEVESNESFFVSLFDPSSGAKLGLTTQVLVTILDDD